MVATKSAAQYASGYLLYQVQHALVAQPFDPVAGKLSGEAIPVVNNVWYDADIWRSVFSVSQNGLMTYQPVVGDAVGRQLTWVDRSGKVLSPVGQRKNVLSPKISPDGKSVAYMSGNLGSGSSDIWTEDLERGTETRVTFVRGPMTDPSWSPDGKRLVYAAAVAQGGGDFEIRSKAADSRGGEKVLLSDAHAYHLPAYTPDGKYITLLWGTGNQNIALWALPLAGDRKLVRILEPPSPTSSFYHYQVSPDGRWLAYVSDESGQNELYITHFPKPSGKWKVSSNGSTYVAWGRNGNELFYKDVNDEFFVVPIASSDSAINIGMPQHLFHAKVSRAGVPFDVSPDGKRLLINMVEEERVTPLNLVVNWPGVLNER